MEKINLMEHITKKKALKETYYKEFNDTDKKKKELSSIERRKLCDEYLIPLLYNYFCRKDTIIAEALQAINNKTSNKKIFANQNEITKKEKVKTFVYQTCLNFVDTYNDLILTERLKEETKIDLIVNAFKYSNLHRDLIRVSNDELDFLDGCYITIDLHETKIDF